MSCTAYITPDEDRVEKQHYSLYKTFPPAEIVALEQPSRCGELLISQDISHTIRVMLLTDIVDEAG